MHISYRAYIHGTTPRPGLSISPGALKLKSFNQALKQPTLKKDQKKKMDTEVDEMGAGTCWQARSRVTTDVEK